MAKSHNAWLLLVFMYLPQDLSQEQILQANLPFYDLDLPCLMIQAFRIRFIDPSQDSTPIHHICYGLGAQTLSFLSENVLL